ncbi:hypothetical protein YC2023_010342 [Brassica napus]
MWRSFFSKPQKAIPESQPVYPIFIICMHGSRKNLTGDTRNNCFVAQQFKSKMYKIGFSWVYNIKDWPGLKFEPTSETLRLKRQSSSSKIKPETLISRSYGDETQSTMAPNSSKAKAA